jgi:hypothetical protein
VLAGAFAAGSPASGGKTRQLGKPAPKVTPGQECGTCNSFQIGTAPESPSYKVPRGKWRIIAWKAAGLAKGEGRSKARLRIYRPTGVTDQFKIIAQSDIESFAADKVTEHRTRIRVKKGDRLGIVGSGDFANLYDTGNTEDVRGTPTNCAAQVGSTVGGGGDCDLIVNTNRRLNVGATIKRR